jgi:large subunit ribosomal protein L11
MAEKVQALVDAGKATPGPPLGPVLGPLGVNIVEIVKVINEKTKGFEGMKVPVTIVVEADKTFKIDVGTPPTTALIKKELNLEKGSKSARDEKVGNLTLDQAVKIAKMKGDDLLGKTTREKVKEVVGTCVSMGITVDGRDPKEVQRAIAEGQYKEKLGN